MSLQPRTTQQERQAPRRQLPTQLNTELLSMRRWHRATGVQQGSRCSARTYRDQMASTVAADSQLAVVHQAHRP